MSGKKSKEYTLSAGFLSTGSSFRRFLNGAPEVLAVREALIAGTLTQAHIEAFVSGLLQCDLSRQLDHELTVVALAVAVETQALEWMTDALGKQSGLESEATKLATWVAQRIKQRDVKGPVEG